MSNARNEEKVENIDKEVNEALTKFVAIFNKPLKKIIEGIYDHDPEAIQQFHLKMNKPLLDDFKTAFTKFKELNEQKSELKPEPDDVILHKVLWIYHQLYKNIDILAESQSRQDNLLFLAMGVYNPDGPQGGFFDRHILLQEDDTFYRDYFYVSAFDPWSLHTLVDNSYINNHFTPSRRYVHDFNPNALYLEGLWDELRQNGLAHPLFQDTPEKINFPPLPPFELFEPDEPNVYACYRDAVAKGSDIALTGLARLYAKGMHGVKKDILFALNLYKIAMKYDVYGALPLDSDDPRILYYSTMLSGMNRSDPHSFIKLSPYLPPTKLKTFWMIRMNHADPTVKKTLKKFEKLAMENPKNIFDSLLDQDPDSISRLRYCVSSDLYEHILRRKQISFKIRSKMLEQKMPAELSKYSLNFISGSNQFLEDPKPNIRDLNLNNLFKMNFSFFKQLEETYLIENRHDDNHPEIQHEYDKRFGLIKK